MSAAGDRLLFTVREENENRIYAIEDPELIAGTGVGRGSADDGDRVPSYAVLPPIRRGSTVALYLDRQRTTLPADTLREVEDYEVDFDLDFVAQPYVVAGSNRFGSFLGGGASFLWSDMLGNHQLGLQVQSPGEIENVAAIAGYENRDSRWYWGGSVSHLPSRAAAIPPLWSRSMDSSWGSRSSRS